MKKAIAIALIFCLGTQLVLRLSIITWFEINQEYIAAQLCENRDKPELVCCGKCVLKKELKKVDDLERSGTKNTNTQIEKNTGIAFILPDSGNDEFPAVPITESAIHNPILPHHFDINISDSIFHPPTVTV